MRTDALEELRTVVFHNFAGTLGVTNALQDGGRLSQYAQPMVPTLVTGVSALAMLVLLDVYVVRRARSFPSI